MKETLSRPCANWAPRLAARRRDDLLPSDRLALHEHLASCQACTDVYTAYNALEMRVRSLPSIRPLPAISFQALQLQQATPASKRPVGLLPHLQRAFATGFAGLSMAY